MRAPFCAYFAIDQFIKSDLFAEDNGMYGPTTD